jgi:PAS domain-containing protein
MLAGTNYRKDREWLKQKAEAILGYDIDASVHTIAVLDPGLNYLFANGTCCQLLKLKKHEMEGHNLLQLFPALTASASHRYLLAAASGQLLKGVLSEGNVTKAGARFATDYYPLADADGVYAILSVTKSIYFPS